jgi:uncharacterized protein (DUF2141 family)
MAAKPGGMGVAASLGMFTRLALASATIALVAVAAPAGGQSSGELRFEISNIDASRGGTVRCALYRNADTWLERANAYKKATAPVSGSSATCVFEDVPAGTYGIAGLHDADDDREMDQSLVGIPEEGYAISRNEIERMTEPDFDEARIEFDGTRKTTRARMEY